VIDSPLRIGLLYTCTRIHACPQIILPAGYTQLQSTDIQELLFLC